MSDAAVKQKNVIMHDRSVKPAKNPKKRPFPFTASLEEDKMYIQYTAKKKARMLSFPGLGVGGNEGSL